jgi:hypothetical protein
MSRNIGETSCEICEAPHTSIELEEAPRPLRAEDAGRYFTEFEGRLTVAAAHCTGCGARYLAWISLTGPWPREPAEGARFVDLSFRSSFNDEPGAADLPTPEMLRQVFARQQRAHAQRLRDEAARLIGEAQHLENLAETGTPFWEAYRR